MFEDGLQNVLDTILTLVISLSARLIEQLDLRQAVSEEADWTPDIVPADISSRFAAANVDQTTSLITELAEAPVDVRRAEVLAASKWRYGRRPVALLPLQERVLYRAVVNYLRDDLPTVVRGEEAYQAFENAPLHDGAAFVVVTDIANFYSSIPLDLITRELTERCGKWEPIQWLHTFWQHVSGGQQGIPQVSEPSHLAAEAYIDELQRRLLRRGIHVWRYADDFRISAPSKITAVDALEMFDEESRKMGLFVNERKTYIPSSSKYKEHRSSDPGDLPEVEMENALAELLDVDPYEEIDEDQQDPDELAGTARQLLELWSEGRLSEDLSVPKQLQVATGLRRSLKILGILEDDEALKYCSKLLEVEPQLTPAVANYMVSISFFNPDLGVDEVLASVKSILQDVPLTKWQRYWILYALAGEGEGKPGIPAGDKYVLEWVRSNLSASSEIVRAQALWTLATNNAVTLDEWNRISQHQTRLTSAYGAACLHKVQIDDAEREQLLASDKFDRLVYEWMSS